MNPRTKSIIVGLYLGDGTITKPRTENDNCFMVIQHSIKQLEYIIWVKEQLSEITNNKEIRQNVRHSGKFNNYITANFETHRHPFFKQLRGCYVDGRKTVKNWMTTWLTPEAIAVWYMDDGSKSMRTRKNIAGETYKYLGGTKIATCSFSVRECQLLVDYLDYKYNINSKIYLTNSIYPEIFFNVENSKKLVGLIEEYIPECMQYKISIQRETLAIANDDML